MPRLARIVALALLAALAAAIPAQARPGDVDSSFGVGGVATFTLPDRDTYLQGVAQQPDGKLVATVVGSSGAGLREQRIFLVRFDRDGSLDRAFGGGDGVVLTPLYEARPEPLVLPDGRIQVVGGKVESETPGTQAVRYLPNGSLDRSFGDDGLLHSNAPAPPPVEDALLQSDGKTVAVGYDTDGTGAGWRVRRFNPDGSRDTGFGQGGVVETDRDGWSGTPAAVAEQPDGKLVVTGNFVRFDPTRVEWAIARYNRDGSPDASFGEGGIALRQLDGVPMDLVLQTDGRPLVAGNVPRPTSAGASAFRVLRTGADGSSDSSFGQGGTAHVPASSDGLFRIGDSARLALQSGGRIAAAGGFAATNSNNWPDPAPDEIFGTWNVARLLSDGSLDPDFGDGGRVSSALGARYQLARSLLATDDGRLVVAGDAGVCGRSTPTLVRYHSEDPAASQPDGGPAMIPCVPSVTIERDGDLPVPTQCPFVEQRCEGTQQVEVSTTVRAARTTRTPKKRFALRGGRSKTLKVRAPSSLRRLLARRRALRAYVRYVARDADGHLLVTRRKVTLRARR